MKNLENLQNNGFISKHLSIRREKKPIIVPFVTAKIIVPKLIPTSPPKKTKDKISATAR